VTFERVVLEICMWTDRLTDTSQYHNALLPSKFLLTTQFTLIYTYYI